MRFTNTVHDHWHVSLDPEGRIAKPLSATARNLIGRSFPAMVPGCVHTDLMRAGELVDPFLDENEKEVSWVGDCGWRYDRAIAWDGPHHERLELVFEGIDTVADIELDGEPIGSVRNMHRTYRIDARKLMDMGEHQLAVRFASAYSEAAILQSELGPRPNAYPEPFNFVRKMACSFGWDWGPTLVTAGIWRPLRLEAWSTARIDSVRPLTNLRDSTGVLTLHVDVERSDVGFERDLIATVRVGDDYLLNVRIPKHETSAVVKMEIPNVNAWYPIGYGDQPLYPVQVELSDEENSEQLDFWQRRVGFRSVAIDRTLDEEGGKFTFCINGKDIFVKGVNWIPDDIFPSRMTPERYKLRIEQAARANVNLVRVWGGGLYESEDFYEACDELGILVWQDFLFACAAYPEEEPIRSEVIAEARENVARLSSHPSLVLWNGNNENLWLHEFENWSAREGGELSWGENYYLNILPEILAEVDPSRPYAEGSPWSGSWDHEPNDPNYQTFHSWEVWNREDYMNYRASTPRFVSEFGWQAPPNWSTLRRAVSDNPLYPDSVGLLHHQKAENGNGKIERGLRTHFKESYSMDAWHYLAQLNQVRAVRTGIEHWRSHWPTTAGTVLWQLNDLWPASSWAAIDGDGKFKPLYFALREMYKDRLITFQPRGAGLVVALVNDTDQIWTAPVAIARQSFQGEVLAREEISAAVPPRSVKCVEVSEEISTFMDVSGEFLIASIDQDQALWFGALDKDLDLPEGIFDVDIIYVDGGFDITVKAQTFIRDLLLQSDRINPQATVDSGFVTLLPGQSKTLRVRSPEPLDLPALKFPYVLTHLERVLSEDLVRSNVE